MRISSELKGATDTYIDDEMDPAHIALLQGLTVWLRGMVGGGGRTTFIGTGFILRLDARVAHVITAKHNLHVAATGLNKSGNALRDYFKEKIEVEFTKVGGQIVKGGIDDIWYPDNTAVDFNYDVAVLVIRDMTFAGHVATFLAPSRTIMSMFASLDWQRKKGNLAETHEGYEEVFTFDVDNNNTSQPGDSGGPIFALDASGTHSWLIGINLGANYYSDKTDNSSQMKNNAFSVVTTNRLQNLL